MTIASYFLRHRRVLVLGGAAALLHYLLIGWVGGHIGIAPGAASAPPVIVAQLHAAPEAAPSASPEPAQPVAKPQSKPAPKPKPRAPKPAPVSAPEVAADALSAEVTPADVAALPDHIASADAATAPAPAQDGAAVAPSAQTNAGLPPPGQAAVPPAQANAQPPAQASAAQGASVPPSAPVPAAGAATPPAAPLVAYKASIPPSTELTLAIDRTEADGNARHGEGAMSWRIKNGGYSMKVEAGINMLITRLNLIVLTSEGSIDATGLVPAKMTERRVTRSLTATHFNRERHQITFSASDAVFGLEPGAQDKATLPLQLASIARADPAQLSGAITIQVGDEKDASVYRFDVVGPEDIDTGIGKIATVHLTRAPKAGAYGSRIDVWLAPLRDWIPVRVRNTEASGAVTTQTVSKIVSTESGH